MIIFNVIVLVSELNYFVVGHREKAKSKVDKYDDFMFFDTLYLSFEFLIIFRIWIEEDLLLVQSKRFRLIYIIDIIKLV